MQHSKTRLDYAFLFGMPVLFLAVAWFGITSLIAPPAPKRPVTLIREGKISVGMTEERVLATIGSPKDVERAPDGSYKFVYHQGTSEPFVEDEAGVEFSGSGVVVRINIEKAIVKPVETQ